MDLRPGSFLPTPRIRMKLTNVSTTFISLPKIKDGSSSRLRPRIHLALRI